MDRLFGSAQGSADPQEAPLLKPYAFDMGRLFMGPLAQLGSWDHGLGWDLPAQRSDPSAWSRYLTRLG